MSDAPPADRRDLGAYLSRGLARALVPGADGPSAFVVTGEAGAGKSHTLRTVPDGVPAAVRQVAGSAAAGRGPYAVLAELLGVDLGRPVPAHAADLLLERLDDLCAAGPTLLVLDDAQEADAASLAVLNTVASAARDLPLALLVARRSRPEREPLARLLRAPWVREVPLPPLDDLDLDALVHQHTGRWPGDRLRAAVSPHRANALRVLTLLDDLQHLGALGPAGHRLELLPGEPAAGALSGGIEEAAAAVVGQLRGPARDVARILAVIGRPATVEEIAAVAGRPAVTLVEPVQTLLDGRIGTFRPDGRLAFTHESYRDAVHRATPDPLLHVLHAAAARNEDSTDRVRHVIASGAPAEEVLAAVRAAQQDLAHAPAVEADLLAGPGAWTGPSAAAVELATGRARALARSGQLDRARSVAREALRHAGSPALTTELHRILIFVTTLQGDTRAAIALLDEAHAAQPPGRVRDILGQHRGQLVQLGGLEPLSLHPPAGDPRTLTLTGLTAEAVRLCLTGHPQPAVELAWEASRRHMSTAVDPYEGASSDVWPPFVELLAGGPRSAEQALRDVQQLREDRAAPWQSAPHQLLRAAIDTAAGRLDDAAAAYDDGLELAAGEEFAWISAAVGNRVMVDVLRDRLDEAETRLRAWRAAPTVLQFGLPQPDRAEVALLEARRRHREAARLADRVWQATADHHAFTWLALMAPELTRVALRAGDRDLRARITADLARLPAPLSPALAPAVELARGMLGADPQETLAAACSAAREAARIGEALTELAAREEAAVAAAQAGLADQARRHGREALRCAEECGASGAARRITGRLRSAGVRLGAKAGRRRPVTGWAALTPTEAKVAELVAAGLSGAGIARSLHISPRTVQTHVSHALAKLGLTSRLELAAAAREQH
ncbi:LuxR C-terminal-related transcriptional regulator [Kitasatospora sp. NPDC094015]|uniref:helix-turn-helix transcriptional regulator n=1 Tax=Kitasatospora sp. NPDC094015 TaxID=3155205 RepID=UPI003330CDC1